MCRGISKSSGDGMIDTSVSTILLEEKLTVCSMCYDLLLYKKLNITGRAQVLLPSLLLIFPLPWDTSCLKLACIICDHSFGFLPITSLYYCLGGGGVSLNLNKMDPAISVSSNLLFPICHIGDSIHSFQLLCGTQLYIFSLLCSFPYQ